MKNKVSFIDSKGQRQPVALSMEHWKAADENNMTLRQYLNVQYPTAHEKYDTFSQMSASCGLSMHSNDKFAIRSTPLKHIFDTPAQLDAATVDQSNPVQSKILFPAFILQYVEDKMAVDRASAVSSFEEMVANTVTVPGFRAEQPVISYGATSGPEDSRSMPRAQLAKPKKMMSITAAERQLAIPEMAIGIEISDEATVGTTLDLVGMALTRQRELEGYLTVGEQLLGLLQGDADISSMTSALTQTKADTIDSTITAAGELTDLAWEKFLYTGLNYRVITHVVTDYDGARAIARRTGRLELQNDYPKDRPFVAEGVFYPNLVDAVKIYIVDSEMTSWPANTLMCMDAANAIQRFRSTAASYSDVERFVLRRGSGFTVAYGEIVTRIWDDAFNVLSLTLT